MIGKAEKDPEHEVTKDLNDSVSHLLDSDLKQPKIIVATFDVRIKCHNETTT